MNNETTTTPCTTPETTQSGCKNCGPSPFVGPMCTECWNTLFNVINFLPILRDRKAERPDSVSDNDWQVLGAFFSKHRNRLFWRGISTKPRYKVNASSDEPTVAHFEYTSNGVLIQNRAVVLVHRERALDVLRGIHCSPEGCKVVGLNSLVKQFCLGFFCNGIRKLAKEFLNSCSGCKLHTPLPTIPPPPRPIRSYGPFERLQADMIDMAPGKKRSFMTNNRGQYRYILVIKDCFSKFCWLIPTKTKSAKEVHTILHNFFYFDEGAPKYLQTDNGTEFIAEVINDLCASLGVKIIHGRPYHPQSQGQVENLNKRVKRNIAKLLFQRSPDEQAKLWPYLLPRVAREINTTWHHTIQDVPFKVLKGRSSFDFHYPMDQDFFDENKKEDDDKFVDDDFLTESDDPLNTQACPLENKAEDEDEEYGNGLPEPVLSFSDRLEIGCSLSRIREETRLHALEATERMIANNTRHRFRMSDERVQRFSMGEVVIFKDPDSIPAKVKKNAKDPFKARNVLGVIKERRALNFYRVQWKKDGKHQVSTLYAGMLYKYQEVAGSQTEDNSSSSFTHRDIADEVSTFSYLFRLNHTTKIQKNVIVLEDVDMGMQELWLALDAGVVASMVFGEAGDCEEVRRHQRQYERGISSLVESHFNLFLIGSVLWEKERMRRPDQLLELLDDTRGSVTSLHAGECATCLAADVCNHQCCHDWFLEIGHRLRLIEDEEAGESGSTEDKESKQYPSDANQESIFSYSRGEQMDDSCDPLFYGQKSTAKPDRPVKRAPLAQEHDANTDRCDNNYFTTTEADLLDDEDPQVTGSPLPHEGFEEKLHPSTSQPMNEKGSQATSLHGNRQTDIAKAIRLSIEERRSILQQEQMLLQNITDSGLEVRPVDIPADGNCLFHAISDQLSRVKEVPKTHSELRAMAVEVLKTPSVIGISKDDLSMYVENNDLPNYLRKMSRDGTWGDHLAIMALATALQRNVWIVSSSRDRGEHIVVESGNESADPLLLGYVSNTHYVSLEPSRELAAIEGQNNNNNNGNVNDKEDENLPNERPSNKFSNEKCTERVFDFRRRSQIRGVYSPSVYLLEKEKRVARKESKETTDGRVKSESFPAELDGNISEALCICNNEAAEGMPTIECQSQYDGCRIKYHPACVGLDERNQRPFKCPFCTGSENKMPLWRRCGNNVLKKVEVLFREATEESNKDGNLLAGFCSSDIKSLMPGEDLNDKVINWTLDSFVQKITEEGGSAVCYSTQLLPKFRRMGYKGGNMERWFTKVNPFEKEWVIVPVHAPGHWRVAVVHMTEGTVYWYDSVTNSESGQANEDIAAIKHILWILAKERKIDIDPLTWKVVAGVDDQNEDIPRQTHGNDCGVFAIMYAIYKVQNMKLDFTVDDMLDIRIWIAGNILIEENSDRAVYESDSSDKEEDVTETNRVVFEQGKSLTQQEVIQMDRSYIENETGCSSVTKTRQKPCHSGSDTKKREKVATEGKAKKAGKAKKSTKRKREMTTQDKKKRMKEWLKDVTMRMEEEDAAMKPAETKESLIKRVESMRPLLSAIAGTPRSTKKPVERYQRHQAYFNLTGKNFRKYQMPFFGTKYFGGNFYFELLADVTQTLHMMFTKPTSRKPGSLWLPPRTFIDLPPQIDPVGVEGHYYINDVLAEEAITLLIMEMEGCDYQKATGLALGHPLPLNTLYHDKWYEILPKKIVPSKADEEARRSYDRNIEQFQSATPENICYADVPWPCDGEAEDMVAVMLSGEEDTHAKIKRIKQLALFWHPDKFLSRYSNHLATKDREMIIEGVLDICKEISRCLEREREEESVKKKNN